MDKILLDLRHAPFSHGQAYVAISRVHEAGQLAVFIDSACSFVDPSGKHVPVMASVRYDELSFDRAWLCGVCAPELPHTPASPLVAERSVRRPRMRDLIAQLDDACAARKVRRVGVA